MAKLVFSEKAWDDYQYWQATDKKTVRKINQLLKDIERSGCDKGIGKPEPLKYRKAWSRRIDQEHRLVYDVLDDDIVIYSLKGHYED